MNRRSPVLGAISCVLFAASALVFAYFTRKIGFLPVRRGWTTVGVYTGFLELWTDVFTLATLVGAVLGALGVRRRTDSRHVAIAGLWANGVAFVALEVVKHTGRI